MKTVIIGSGNIATHLAKALQKNGFEILQVISKHKKNAEALASVLNCNATTDIDLAASAALYIIAVNDNEIEKVAKQLSKAPLLNAIKKNELPLVLHTAASVSIDVLENEKWNAGVLYPLQTMKKNVAVDLKQIPFIISGASKKIKTIASAISNKVTTMNDEQRLALHISAVFVNNFTNHIVGIAQEICKQEKIDFKILQPLLSETFEKLQKFNAAENQTGPAIRGDENTINKHLQFLTNPSHKKIYKELTLSIQRDQRFKKN